MSKEQQAQREQEDREAQAASEAWIKAQLSREPTEEENVAATEAWRPFMVELKALLDKYGVTEFGACSCCNGLNIATKDSRWVSDVEIERTRAGISTGVLKWSHMYSEARLPNGDDGAETSSNP